jgi:nitrogen fixation/metabolism regulation signal transduction histidine kinase
MEDHGGRLSLEDGEGGGAKVTLTFVRPAAAAEDSVEAKRAAHGA